MRPEMEKSRLLSQKQLLILDMRGLRRPVVQIQA